MFRFPESEAPMKKIFKIKHKNETRSLCWFKDVRNIPPYTFHKENNFSASFSLKVMFFLFDCANSSST